MTRLLAGLLLAGAVLGAGDGGAQAPDPCAGRWTSGDVPARCWALRADSVYRGRGTDGRDLGANIPLLDAMERCVLSGGADRAACAEYESLRAAAYDGAPVAPRNLRIGRER